MVKIGVNGFGRIGRTVVRVAAERKDIQIVGINEPLIDTEYMAYLIKYDSVYGKFNSNIMEGEGKINISNNDIAVFGNVCPAEIPWKECGAEYIIEASGECTEDGKASAHFRGGAKKVVISASSKDISMFSMGINHETYSGEKIVSCASAEANCIAALMSVLETEFGVEQGIVTCVNSVNSCQKTVDGINRRDWRGGRAAYNSVIPVASGAAHAVGRILPSAEGKLSGITLRVPTLDVCSASLVCLLKTKTDYETVKNAMKKASEENLRGILGYTDECVVSCDFKGCTQSAVFDANASLLQNGNLLKITAWYDNEWGYVSRMLDFVQYMDKMSEQ
ncbi:MAG: glyceraldehyde 3-phosphate dehydrogenase NAD-binding domain-containing protein [Bacillota bacterium]|nr:glyceraldehyde 3-phosphate dehydrogenase NAD-binding domain-containing protein [Bacillota bacterium]